MEDELFLSRMVDMDRMRTVGFMTEFGSIPNDSVSIQSIERIMDNADGERLSWGYWSYKNFYLDETNQSEVRTTLYNINGTIQYNKVKALTRPFAQAVAGRSQYMNFDSVNAVFTLKFVPDLNIRQPTVISINKLWYPNGVRITVEPEGSLLPIKHLSYPLLELFNNPRANAETIAITIQPN